MSRRRSRFYTGRNKHRRKSKGCAGYALDGAENMHRELASKWKTQQVQHGMLQLVTRSGMDSFLRWSDRCCSFNNDGMGMSMFNAWAKDNKVLPSVDANSDAGSNRVKDMAEQFLSMQTFRLTWHWEFCVTPDGADIDTGIGTADEAGNCLTEVRITDTAKKRDLTTH